MTLDAEQTLSLPELQALIMTRLQQLADNERLLIALAGAPASGKSTLAAQLCTALNNELGMASTVVVPMDGFHLDNTLLRERGLLARKGAAETFDAAGFVHLVRRLRHEREVVFPVFDRALDKAIAGVGEVTAQQRCVLVEGNYLLLQNAPWCELGDCWDLSVGLPVPLEELERRLVKRWLDYGYTEEAALAKAQQNDLLNAQYVVAQSLPAHYQVVP